MDWGVELWDQFENVDKHLHHGIEHTEKYMKFVQERSAIEQEYAKKLRRLFKSYQPKKKDDESSMFSTHKAFHSQLSELNDIAGQHELVAENYFKNIAKTLHTFINELRAEKKKAYQEGKHLQASLDAQERVLEQTKKRFEKEWKESERAHAFFLKLDSDPNVTKAEVDKARQASTAKKDSVESCKADYASALTKFNSDQQNHYQSLMPKVFENIRDMDERRIKRTSEVMVEFAKYDSDVKPIINKCLEGMKQAAEAVDANLDAGLVVGKYKSGFLPPGDKEFEDYTSPQYGQSAGDDHANSPRNSMNVSKAANKKGLSWLFGGKKPKSPLGGVHRPSSMENSAVPDSNISENQQSDGSADANGTNSPVARERPGSGKQTDVAVTTDSQNGASESVTRDKKSTNPDALRHSLSAGRKKILSMFKDKPSDSPPARPSKPPRRGVEISGPVTSKSDSARLPVCDSFIPIQSDTEKISQENPYCEVYDEDEFSDVSHEGSMKPDEPAKVVESADYSHLPPEQRKKKLQKHIDELRQNLAKETDGRNGIMKMKDVYSQNPSLGDASTLEVQIKQYDGSIAKIEADLHQYETWYADASGGAPPKSSINPSRSPSVVSQSPSKVAYSQPLKTEEPEARKPELTQQQSFGDEFDDDVVGSCVALFDFAADSDGAMSMKEGDHFSIIEADKGDGWTRVVKGDMDGYVPTSYLEVKFD